jgi:hypothetical protein
MRGVFLTVGLRPKTWTARRILLLVCAVSNPCLLYGADYRDVDVKPFGYLGTRGSLSIRYYLEENGRTSESSVRTFENRSTWEQDLFLVSRSYVYHPGFLNMELGGGPLLIQQQFDSDAGSNSNNEALLNLLARFNFLDLKTYPFSLYFRRSHPSVTTSLSGRFLTRNEEYGLSGRKSLILGNDSFSYEFRHRDTEGSGLDVVVDEDEDRRRFKYAKNYRRNDRIAFEYNEFDRTSSSGSLGLPIQESTIRQKRANINAANRFGAGGKYRLHQSIVQIKHENDAVASAEQEDLLYTASARWQSSASISSSFDYAFNQSERTGADINSHNFTANVTHNITPALNYDVRANHENLNQTAFSRDRSGLGIQARFSGETDIGSYQLSTALRQERTDQESFSDSAQVFDEPVTLVGTTPVDLANEFVVPGSVVVTNSAGTQVFVENVDYRLIVVGSVTSIQRLIDGSIFDGQTVFVDYLFQTSGTTKFDRFFANAVVSTDFLRLFRARLRYSQLDSNPISGELTTPLNDTEVLEFVVGANVPINYRWGFSAEYRHIDNDEEIAPSVRDSLSVGANVNVFGSTSMQLGATWLQVDQEQSVEDVEQVTYRLGIKGNVFGLARFSYLATYLEDTGGSLPRKQLLHNLTIQGRYRQVMYALQARYNDDSQGATERDSTQVSVLATRYFY